MISLAYCRSFFNRAQRTPAAWREQHRQATFLPELTGRIHLANDILTRLLVSLEEDGIYAGELREAKRQLRHGADWSHGEVKPAT